LRRRLIEHLTLRGYAERTIEAYVGWVRPLAAFFRISPDRLGEDQLLDFLRHLHGKGLADSTINQAVNALIYFYAEVLGRPAEALKSCLPRPRKATRLPRAYSVEQIDALLQAARRDLLHYTFLSCLYHTGLRLHEACNLPFYAVERSSHRIYIMNGKGKKDRYTILPQRLSDELVDYYKNYRVQYGKKVPWMFVGKQSPAKPLPDGTAQRFFHRIRERAGLPHIGGIHTLRHSFATHQLLAGMDLVRLKTVLGHKNLTTTMRYLHLVQTQEAYDPGASPLDVLSRRSKIRHAQ
jgi:integrase/recombinase XerD